MAATILIGNLRKIAGDLGVHPINERGIPHKTSFKGMSDNEIRLKDEIWVRFDKATNILSLLKEKMAQEEIFHVSEELKDTLEEVFSAATHDLPEDVWKDITGWFRYWIRWSLKQCDSPVIEVLC